MKRRAARTPRAEADPIDRLGIAGTHRPSAARRRDGAGVRRRLWAIGCALLVGLAAELLVAPAISHATSAAGSATPLLPLLDPLWIPSRPRTRAGVPELLRAPVTLLPGASSSTAPASELTTIAVGGRTHTSRRALLERALGWFYSRIDHGCSASPPIAFRLPVAPELLAASASFGCCDESNGALGSVLVGLGFPVWAITSPAHSALVVEADGEVLYVDADQGAIDHLPAVAGGGPSPYDGLFRDGEVRTVECTAQDPSAPHIGDRCLPRIAPWHEVPAPDRSLLTGEWVWLDDTPARDAIRHGDEASSSPAPDADATSQGWRRWSLEPRATPSETLPDASVCRPLRIASDRLLLGARVDGLPVGALAEVRVYDTWVRLNTPEVTFAAQAQGLRAERLLASRMAPLGGQPDAVTTRLDYPTVTPWLTREAGGEPALSAPRLFEDDRELREVERGPQSSDGVEPGTWAFSGEGSIVFASSDGSAPASEQHRYRLEYTAYRGLFHPRGRTLIDLRVCAPAGVDLSQVGVVTRFEHNRRLIDDYAGRGLSRRPAPVRAEG